MKSRLPATMVIMALLSEALTIALYLAFKQGFHANPFAYHVNHVVSAGAILFGLIGASGASFGSRFAEVPRNGLAMALTAALTGLALLTYHLLQYASSAPAFASFADYVTAHDTRATASDFLWAMGCSLLVWGPVERLPWCYTCGCFHEADDPHPLRFASAAALAAATRALPLDAPERAAALLHLDQEPGIADVAGTVRLELRPSHCPKCGIAAISERLDHHDGRHFVHGTPRIRSWKARPAHWETLTPPAPSILPAPSFGHKQLAG